MRIVPFTISTMVTVALVIAFSNKWGSIPPLGKFLSPQQGFWQNAEPADVNFTEQLSVAGLKGEVRVYLDDRLVPHIFAGQDEDAYFVQGFLHAKNRLWQMEFQLYAAAGRISEILGADPRFLRFDREQRRLGMVYGAENTLKEMTRDTASKKYFDAYSAGVNAYIASLTPATLPLEYKLLDYKPEPWTNLKIALLLKLMSKDLTGYERDLEFTNQKSVFGLEKIQQLFPDISDSSVAFTPRDSFYAKPGIVPVPPASADSLYFGKDTTVKAVETAKPDPLNGSNNWAVSGSKTASGAPILCNDPHLNFSLPSLWYEMQLTTPNMNVYGATFPGSPSVIIGFNDSVSFGFTNAQRDVKDYYTIRFKDNSKKEYWYNGKWEQSRIKVETIKVRGGADVQDTVAYTVFGPVMYDKSFVSDSAAGPALAVRWTAHDPSNDCVMWMKLNKARNYNDYLAAIKDFVCPGQNMLFASHSGDIAVWQQAKFPARWKGQGLYIMPGEDSSYRWQGFVPQAENPHVINPPGGFIQSANQRPADSGYPYFIPGNYIESRGITLNRRLSSMQNIKPADMMALQNDYFNWLASVGLPLFLRRIDETALNGEEKKYLEELKGWDFYAKPGSRAATIFQAWFDSLEKAVWKDDFAGVRAPKVLPDEETLIEGLLRDSVYKYADDISTAEVETPAGQLTQTFRKAAAALRKEEKEDGLLWWKHKNISIPHLLRTVLPFGRQHIYAGGWSTTVNAITNTHGPSWRMIVQMTSPVEAYGIYPGGQSGNPGSRFYDNFIDNWAAGKYYTLWLMKESEKSDKRIVGTLTFTKA